MSTETIDDKCTDFQKKAESFSKEILVHQEFLLNYAKKMFDNYHDGEDLYQLVIQKAWKNFDKYKEGTNGKAWVSKIMERHFINESKRRTKLKETPLDDGNVNYLNFLSDENTSTGNPLYNSNSFYNIEKLSITYNVICDRAEVSDKHRKILWMNKVEQIEQDEISDILSIPLNTVRTAIGRAKQKLSKLLRYRLSDEDIEAKRYDPNELLESSRVPVTTNF
jgi:RNA polymerase sigma-70 factor, ECF subfamily